MKFDDLANSILNEAAIMVKDDPGAKMNAIIRAAYHLEIPEKTITIVKGDNLSKNAYVVEENQPNRITIAKVTRSSINGQRLTQDQRSVVTDPDSIVMEVKVTSLDRPSTVPAGNLQRMVSSNKKFRIIVPDSFYAEIGSLVMIDGYLVQLQNLKELRDGVLVATFQKYDRLEN